MLQPCSFSMSVYDNTIQHLQVCGPELLHVIWLAGFCPSSLASKPCSLFRKSRKKWTFSLRLINAEIVRCWNLLWNSTMPSPESIQPDSSPGNGPHKKNTQTNFGGSTHCASIPLDISTNSSIHLPIDQRHSLSIENVPRNFFGRWSLSIPWRPKARRPNN